MANRTALFSHILTLNGRFAARMLTRVDAENMNVDEFFPGRDGLAGPNPNARRDPDD